MPQQLIKQMIAAALSAANPATAIEHWFDANDFKHNKMPLKSSLLRLKNVNSGDAVQVFKLVRRKNFHDY